MSQNMYQEFQVAFYFLVELQEATCNGKKVSERERLAFKEVSGLSLEIETESLREGGTNLEYKLPKGVKHGNLVLKRALVSGDSGLVGNLKKTFQEGFAKPFIKQNILISLLNEKGESMHAWKCIDAYPVKWEITTLDSERNELVIEHVEFAYTTLEKHK